MKTSNLSSFDKLVSYSINGNYVDAYSLDGRGILINHRSLYNSLWLNYNQENLNTVIRITLFDNTTIDLTFNTKYLANGTVNGPLLNSNTFVLPIQHKNIQLISNPLHAYGGAQTICSVYAADLPSMGESIDFKMLVYDDEEQQDPTTCVQLFSGQDPGDCDSTGVLDAGTDYLGKYLRFELGTCS